MKKLVYFYIFLNIIDYKLIISSIFIVYISYIYIPNFFSLHAKLFSFQIKMKNQSFLSKKKEDKNRMEKKKKKILEKDVIRKKKGIKFRD